MLGPDDIYDEASWLAGIHSYRCARTLRIHSPFPPHLCLIFCLSDPKPAFTVPNTCVAVCRWQTAAHFKPQLHAVAISMRVLSIVRCDTVCCTRVGGEKWGRGGARGINERLTATTPRSDSPGVRAPLRR